MSTAGWIVLLAVGIPLIGFLVFLLLDESFVRIDSGKLGLLLVKGRATDKVLLPGPHWVPSLRRMSVEEYPSLELAYRADPAPDTPAPSDTGRGGRRRDSGTTTDNERSGPVLAATLGDRALATVSYTVRACLDPDSLRSVHERFGPDGLWAILRDEADRTVAAVLGDPAHTVDDLFGSRRVALEEAITAALRESLGADGLRLTMFRLGKVDLGRAGEAIQATVRARYELEREQADAATRLARARNDAELAPLVEGIPVDVVMRYRETELWREVAQRPDGVSVVLPGPGGAAGGAAVPTDSDDAGGGLDAGLDA
jgi:hypothetical protein